MLLEALLDRVGHLSIGQIVEMLDDEKTLAILEMREEEAARERFGKFKNLFPDMADCSQIDSLGRRYTEVGSSRFYARDYYQKHLDFFRAGAFYRSRCLLAANRVGKTIAGAYEMACHLTGKYPHWWEGKQFRHPIRAWACGKTNETTRDIVQTTLLGDIEYHGARKTVDGSGVIPREFIGVEAGQISWKQGVQDLIDTVKIKHTSGGWSRLGLKSYQQGRGAFEGTAQHVIWDDEEPPLDVYGEQIIRTATTKGVQMLTFTPLMGISEVVQQFMEGGDHGGIQQV